MILLNNTCWLSDHVPIVLLLSDWNSFLEFQSLKSKLKKFRYSFLWQNSSISRLNTKQKFKYFRIHRLKLFRCCFFVWKNLESCHFCATKCSLVHLKNFWAPFISKLQVTRFISKLQATTVPELASYPTFFHYSHSSMSTLYLVNPH